MTTTYDERLVHPGVIDALTRGLTASSDVLEIGCRTCNFLRAIRERVHCNCTGVDPSSAILAHAPKDVGALHCCAAERLELASEAFDLVYSIDVIHHVRRPAAFDEMARVLRSGGRVCTVISSPIATLEGEIARAGFADVRVEEMAGRPVMIWATNP
jgi:ubiquinone/menaquinone biosynthesis C-methylase UbiE